MAHRWPGDRKLRTSIPSCLRVSPPASPPPISPSHWPNQPETSGQAVPLMHKGEPPGTELSGEGSGGNR